ncbi:MAG: kinase [Acidimicrobiaceae bacterium]|jgi:NAD+ kinase
MSAQDREPLARPTARAHTDAGQSTPRAPEPTPAADTPPTPVRRRVDDICFVASAAPLAQQALVELCQLHRSVGPEEADVIVALGGDGFMLETMHRYLRTGKPFFGMNRGNVGFLMNEFRTEGLFDRVMRAERATLYPLAMTARSENGTTVEALAINEVSLLRQSRQAATIRISVNNVVRLPELVCDGLMLATPAGSTAYNLSANGPIVPLRAPLLALTPVSPFRPRGWRGALLPSNVEVRLEVLERWKRPVSAVADQVEVRNVVDVDIREDPSMGIELLSDPHRDFHERILVEQFSS